MRQELDRINAYLQPLKSSFTRSLQPSTTFLRLSVSQIVVQHARTIAINAYDRDRNQTKLPIAVNGGCSGGLRRPVTALSKHEAKPHPIDINNTSVCLSCLSAGRLQPLRPTTPRFSLPGSKVANEALIDGTMGRNGLPAWNQPFPSALELAPTTR